MLWYIKNWWLHLVCIQLYSLKMESTLNLLPLNWFAVMIHNSWMSFRWKWHDETYLITFMTITNHSYCVCLTKANFLLLKRWFCEQQYAKRVLNAYLLISLHIVHKPFNVPHIRNVLFVHLRWTIFTINHKPCDDNIFSLCISLSCELIRQEKNRCQHWVWTELNSISNYFQHINNKKQSWANGRLDDEWSNRICANNVRELSKYGNQTDRNKSKLKWQLRSCYVMVNSAHNGNVCSTLRKLFNFKQRTVGLWWWMKSIQYVEVVS